MLTAADDYPIHQTPEPIAFSGTDRNFYDRYFFNGYTVDGSIFFACAFGVYPALGIVDAHFSVTVGDKQFCLHASREANGDRMDLTVGPVAITVEQPLQALSVRVAATEGIAADLRFGGRSHPILEPRFTYRRGTRTIMDYTRMTQNGHWSGWVSVDGKRMPIEPMSPGTRDRSWGIRPVGATDAQPVVPPGPPQFFWQWTPINLPDRSVFFHLNAETDGTPWNTRAVVVPDGSTSVSREYPEAQMTVRLDPGTRWPDGGTLVLPGDKIQLAAISRFQMRGLGYTSPAWGHGMHHGSLAVEREDIALAAIDPAALENLHVQMLCRVTDSNGGAGLGVFEQLAIGPYEPLQLSGITSPPA